MLVTQKIKDLVSDLCKKDQNFRKIVQGTELEEFDLVAHENFSKLEIIGILGNGTFGIVYLAQDLSNHYMQSRKFYAVKSIQKHSNQCKLPRYLRPED